MNLISWRPIEGHKSYVRNRVLSTQKGIQTSPWSDRRKKSPSPDSPKPSLPTSRWLTPHRMRLKNNAVTSIWTWDRKLFEIMVSPATPTWHGPFPWIFLSSFISCNQDSNYGFSLDSSSGKSPKKKRLKKKNKTCCLFSRTTCSNSESFLLRKRR